VPGDDPLDAGDQAGIGAPGQHHQVDVADEPVAGPDLLTARGRPAHHDAEHVPGHRGALQVGEERVDPLLDRRVHASTSYSTTWPLS
jgi:hypothetical protein